MSKNFSVASLFAGIGGIDLAFHKAGFEISWANEIDKKACDTYSENFSQKIICEDIKKLNPSKLDSVDVIAGGFPCQAFSVAGLRRGLEDIRGTLIFDLLKIAKELEPKVIFLENVKNLKSHNEGKTFSYIVDSIKKLGYQIKFQIINTAEYSQIPQNRERIYMACFKDEKAFNAFSFPGKISKTFEIVDLLEDKVDDCFYYNRTKYYPLLKKEIRNKSTCYQWRRKYVRENKSNLCPTLTANMGTGGHNVPLILDNKGIRKLTPRECARFQGFPENFKFPKSHPNSAIYKQVGNSVSVPVVERIAKNIFNAMCV